LQLPARKLERRQIGRRFEPGNGGLPVSVRLGELPQPRVGQREQ